MISIAIFLTPTIEYYGTLTIVVPLCAPTYNSYRF